MDHDTEARSRVAGLSKRVHDLELRLANIEETPEDFIKAYDVSYMLKYEHVHHVRIWALSAYGAEAWAQEHHGDSRWNDLETLSHEVIEADDNILEFDAELIGED